MDQTQAVATLGGAKTAALAFLTAHPIGVAVVGGALIGMGAYYTTKAIANLRSKKASAPAEAAAVAAA